MSLIRCSRTAAAVARLAEQDAKAMERLWLREYEAAKSSGLGLGAAENQASQAVRNSMIALAAHMRFVAQLQKEAMDRIDADASRFRAQLGAPGPGGKVDIGEYAIRLVNDVHFRSQALFQLDMKELSALLHEFRRTTLSGKRQNRARMDLVVREIFGEDTGDATAKAFAQSWNALARRKIEQFNSAGGNVALRDDWHMPQQHNALAVTNAGLHEWKNYIRGRLDMAAMTNPRTGKAFTASEFEDFLDEAFVSISWQTAQREASMQGQYGTAGWRRHADPRFFVFKDAASWLEYSAKYGSGRNPFETMMGYLRSINHDLAGMQMLGPHANGTMRWLAGSGENVGGRILEEAIKADQGKPSLFAPVDDTGRRLSGKARQQYAKDKAVGAQRAWDYFTGEARRPFHDGWATVEGDINNLLYANMLPFTPFLVGGDIMNQAATRAFRGMGRLGMLRDFVDAIRLSRDPATLSELLVEVDAGLSVMLSEARDQASVLGHAPSQWVTDRTMTFTGLKPMTMGLRAMWNLGVLHEITRHANGPFNKIKPEFRAMLEQYGIDEHAWEYVRNAPRRTRRGVSVITPGDIQQTNLFSLGVQVRPGLSQGEEVAARIMQMIKQEGEYAVISGTPRSARILPYRPGSISGTILGSVAKLKTYSISHLQHHGVRAAEIFWRNGAGVRGMTQGSLYYMGSLIVPSVLLVAMGTIAAETLKGKEPPDVTDPAFWNSVVWKTLSLGFYQDYLRSVTDPDASKLQTSGNVAGPTMGAIADLAQLGGDFWTEGNTMMRGGEDTTHTGRQAIRTARRFVPRHWATDVATERLIWDNLQRWADPEADEDFQRRARRVEQGMWWEPGNNLPNSAPDMSTLDLTDQDSDYVQ